MKRRLLVALIGLAVPLVAASAAAATSGFVLQVNGSDSPTVTVQVGTALQLTGNAPGCQATHGGCEIGAVIGEWAGPTCDTESEPDQIFDPTLSSGGYSYDVSGLAPGTYSFEALVFDSAVEETQAQTNCVTVTVTAAATVEASVPRPPDGIFLCYNASQPYPSVFPKPLAETLLAGGGYWVPVAVPGNVAGGTNIGSYHLSCNTATFQAAGDQFVGDGGDVSSPALHSILQNVLGWYPAIP